MKQLSCIRFYFKTKRKTDKSDKFFTIFGSAKFFYIASRQLNYLFYKVGIKHLPYIYIIIIISYSERSIA